MVSYQLKWYYRILLVLHIERNGESIATVYVSYAYILVILRLFLVFGILWYDEFWISWHSRRTTVERSRLSQLQILLNYKTFTSFVQNLFLTVPHLGSFMSYFGHSLFIRFIRHFMNIRFIFFFIHFVTYNKHDRLTCAQYSPTFATMPHFLSLV